MCREGIFAAGNLLQSRQALQQAPDVTYRKERYDVQNIAETTPVRNPRSVNDRRSHQCARSGWRPRRRTPRQLGRDIADAIRQHRAVGDAHGVEPSEFTPDAETQAMVRQLLAADATPQR